MLEYIFENRKYDMALRDVKATLFDIVSAEEAKIASLMDKIYKSNDADYQAQLVDVCNAQDECLKRVLKIFSELEKTLKKLDSYSRELKHIENDNLNDIIANYKGVVNEQARTLEQLTAAGQMNNQMAAGQMVNEQVAQNQMPNQAAVPQGMEQPTEYPIEEQEINVEPQAQVQQAGTQPEQAAAQVQEEVPMNAQSSEQGAPEQQEVVEELVPKEEAPAVVDTPADTEATVQEAPVDTPVADAEATVQEAPVDIPAVNTENATQEDVIIPYDDSISTVVADEEKPKTDEESNSEVVENNNIIIPQPEVTETVVTDENVSQATLISGKDEEKVEGNVAESMLTQLITDPNANADNSQNTSEVSSESTPLIIPMINTGNSSTDQPAAANPADNQAALDSNKVLVFKKKNNDAAKVIITSATQTSKLRSSLSAQEQALNGLGFFMSDANLESQLVQNGLLPGDKQAQLEQMMNTANSLYAEGKVEEAQKMYDDISALNKETQAESVGMAI